MSDLKTGGRSIAFPRQRRARPQTHTLRQADLDPQKLVFIDETWAKTNMTRLRGRAPSGQRLVEKVPHGHWKTTTLIAALDCRGIRCGMTVDGAVNGEVFEAFVAQVLLPSLRPGDIVVMDNLSSHKSVAVRADRRRRRPAALPAAVLAGPESDRAAVQQIKQRLRSLALR